MNKVIIIGGGAAGLLAAISAAQRGADVTILERMERAGRKLMITGKGRCNITNHCTMDEMIAISRVMANSFSVLFIALPMKI